MVKSKKAPRPGAFLLPKPKPMRRITLLDYYNDGPGFRFHNLKKNNYFFVHFFNLSVKAFLNFSSLGFIIYVQ